MVATQSCLLDCTDHWQGMRKFAASFASFNIHFPEQRLLDNHFYHIQPQTCAIDILHSGKVRVKNIWQYLVVNTARIICNRNRDATAAILCYRETKSRLYTALLKGIKGIV